MFVRHSIRHMNVRTIVSRVDVCTRHSFKTPIRQHLPFPTIPSSRVTRFATFRNVPGTPRYGRPSTFRHTSPYPWSILLKPLAFTALFTGSSFGLAWYIDTRTHYTPDADAKIKVLASLIALNAAFFACHHVPPYWRVAGPIYRFTSRYGTLHVSRATEVPASLFTSGFSHAEVWHLGLNMVGLYTIGSPVFDLLGQNQFLASYGSAVCVSGFAQLVAGLIGARRGCLPRGSLGASGGVYALLGAVAWYAPASSVYLLFFPFIPIQLGYAFTGMMALDAVGLVRGWTMFGHAAHLTGGLCGLLYGVAQVPEAWMAKRRESMRRYLSRWGR